MRRALLLAVAGLALSGCATISNYLGGRDNTQPPAELVDFRPLVEVRTLWSRDVGASSEGLLLTVAVSDGKVFAADAKGRVKAYDAESGAVLWETDTDTRISGGPGVGDDLVLVGTRDAEVLALSQETGKVLWKVRVSSVVLAPPRAADGVVVVRSIDGRLSGLSSVHGQRLWIYSQSVPTLTLRGTSAPVLHDDIVVCGFDGGRVAALDPSDGRPLWETRISVPRGRSELQRMVDVDSSPLVMDGVVYAVTYQGRVAALDLASGRVIWRRDMSSYAGLGADAQNLYVTDDLSRVWALDRYTNASVWRQGRLHDRFLTAPTALDDYVVVGDFEGYLHWLRREDGQFAARVRVDDDGVAVAPIAVGDTLYVYGRGGSLTALRPAQTLAAGH